MIASRLREAQNTDGGFGPRPGLRSEPEPTALATIALDDAGGRVWLGTHQVSDGSVPLDDGIGVLRDRETAGGGWNSGNTVTFGDDLGPYAQTTAAALVALQHADPDLDGGDLDAEDEDPPLGRPDSLSLSPKNCFGCVPGRVYDWPKNALHWAGIQQSILDVAGAVRPDYAIVDGIVGMEGNGPISGTPLAANVLIFGDDPVATDVIGARVEGFDPEKVEYLAEAARFLGQGDVERIRNEGEDIDDVTTDSPCSRSSSR
ncbi:MAG: DUF362 domain-containing protein [Actinomycetota bacterium]